MFIAFLLTIIIAIVCRQIVFVDGDLSSLKSIKEEISSLKSLLSADIGEDLTKEQFELIDILELFDADWEYSLIYW